MGVKKLFSVEGGQLGGPLGKCNALRLIAQRERDNAFNAQADQCQIYIQYTKGSLALGPYG